MTRQRTTTRYTLSVTLDGQRIRIALAKRSIHLRRDCEDSIREQCAERGWSGTAAYTLRATDTATGRTRKVLGGELDLSGREAARSAALETVALTADPARMAAIAVPAR